MKIMVIGGRAFTNTAAVWRELDARLHEITVVITSDAPGACAAARSWTKARGVILVVENARWGQFGRAAGCVRAVAMFAQGPDLVLAFPGGIGTAGELALGRARGVPIVRFTDA